MAGAIVGGTGFDKQRGSGAHFPSPRHETSGHTDIKVCANSRLLHNMGQAKCEPSAMQSPIRNRCTIVPIPLGLIENTGVPIRMGLIEETSDPSPIDLIANARMPIGRLID